MLKKITVSFAVFLFITAFGCATPESRYCGPLKIYTDSARELKSPGFWTSRHPFADEKLLDDSGVRRLNERIRNRLHLTKDVSGTLKTNSGEALIKTLKSSLDLFSSGTYYLKTSRIADRAFLLDLEKNVRAGAIPENIRVKFGLTNSYADQRILPTMEGLFENPGDTVFDELQNSSLDLGTPLAILHESRDGKWLYARGPSSDGWIEKEKVSFLNRAKLKNYLDQTDFIVVVSSRADIFLDPGMTVYHDYVRMGARFPAIPGNNPSVVEITIPARGADGGAVLKKAYIRKESVNFGYLAYTPRNVIDQAFRLINAPYSWGSANSEQDCSGFVQQVFATFGIFLPRNSSAQAEVGTLLGKFGRQTEDLEKITVLSEKAAGGATLIYLDGHIMIFLGMHEGNPYVIHDTWSYRSKGQFGDEPRVIGRVVVTGLDLGEGSSRGSLLKRVVSIRSILE
jgi:hypothetical protein